MSKLPVFSRRLDKVTILLLLVCAIPLLIQLSHGLPNRDAVWIPDANPLVPLVTLKRVFLDGWNTGHHSPYPDFHYWILCIVLVPYMLTQLLFGNLEGLSFSGGYPYGVTDFQTIFMHIALLTRVVTVAMALGATYFTTRISKVLFPEQPIFFTGLIFAFAPTVVYYSHGETLDVPMLFWLSFGVLHYVKALKSFEWSNYFWLAISAAFATATKDYAYGAFVLMPLTLVIALAYHTTDRLSFKSIITATFDRRHLKAIIVFAFAFTIAENLIWNPSGFINHIFLSRGLDTSVTITTDFSRHDYVTTARVGQLWRLLPFTLGWCSLFLSLAGAGLLACKDRRTFLWLLCPAISFYIFTIVPVLPASGNNERTTMGLLVPLAVFGGYFLADLWNNQRVTLLARNVCILLTMLVLSNGIAMVACLAYDTRYQAELWLEKNTDRNEVIGFMGYRQQSPRASVVSNMNVINHRTAAGSNDTQISTGVDLVHQIKMQQPAILIVSEAYVGMFRNITEHSNVEYTEGNKLLKAIESGDLGYVPSIKLTPRFGYLFGMPRDRQLVPGLTIYKKSQSQTPTLNTGE